MGYFFIYLKNIYNDVNYVKIILKTRHEIPFN